MKKAFTLAEVLISLGIIGLVAAFSLPSIMRLNSEATIGPRLAKIQSAMEEATSRVMLDDPSKPIGDIDKFEDKIAKHLSMKGSAGDGYRLKDGMQISFEGATTLSSKASGAGFRDVIVDINGADGKPNVDGVDKFRFTLSTNGLMVAQGCAALIQSNNWKTPKNYDSVACLTYDIGSGVDTSGNEITKDDELTSKTKECSDGSVVPINATCKKLCADGKYVAEDADCADMYTCWDGSQAISKEYCPPEPAKFTCDDGSVVEDEADCKKECWSGYYVQQDEKCPYKCLNGDIVEDESQCMVECWDGKEIHQSEYPYGCGQVKETCDDGAVVLMGAKCPTPLPDTRDTLNDYVYCQKVADDGTQNNLKHYAWNAATGEWEHLEGVYYIAADGTYNYTGKQVNNAALQSYMQGYVQTGEDGIFFKNDKYYTYNDKTLTFEETEFEPPIEWFTK